jgi:hypothetical protein
MKSTVNMRLVLTAHAKKQMVEKGFSEQDVYDMFFEPSRVYPSKSHPGQFRVAGNGMCLVGRPSGVEFVCITMYADGVLTPPRPDQLLTPEGRRYAERYERGLGRG